ncbi:hypothetical protein FQN54_007767 [Arachnomyces sp. PD_36]|nr:hypothetical protein FQN54_007767 [Arachnomyces sp. PD_36]
MMSLPRRSSAESRRKYRQARRQHTISHTEPEVHGLNYASHPITSQAGTPSISFQPSPPYNPSQHLVPQQQIPTSFSGSSAGVENYLATSFDGQFAPAMETVPMQEENWSPFPFQATIDPPEQGPATLSYDPAAKPAFASISPPTEQIPAEDLKYVRLARSDSALGAGTAMPSSSTGYMIPHAMPFGPQMQQPQPQSQSQSQDFSTESYPLSYSPTNISPLQNQPYPETAVLSDQLSHSPGLLSSDPQQYPANPRHLSPSGQWGSQVTPAQRISSPAQHARSGIKRETSLPLVLASSPGSEPFPIMQPEASSYHSGGYVNVSGGEYIASPMPYCLSPPPTFDDLSPDPQAGYLTSRPHALSASAELGIPFTMAGSTSAGSYPRTISPASSPGRDDQQVRVLNSRPKPQCWDHGCNGRQFSTFSNLLRHQREKSGAAAKSECPHCGIVFTRTTARNGHLAQGKCKGRRGSME